MTGDRSMLDESFDRDLRAVLDEMAPRVVPQALRDTMAETAFRAPVARAPRWLVAGAVAMAALLVVAGLAEIATQPNSTPGGVIASPRSSLITGWVEQTDGVYGYTILRPANWTPAGGDFPDGRQYLGPGPATDQQGIVIRAVNLQLPAAHPAGPGSSGLWPLFQQHPTLDGWTAAIEDQIRSAPPSSFVVLRTLPEARLYQMTYPGLGYVFLVAYVVDSGQPLIISLSANGTDADLGRLQAQGIVDDFATMVASVTAIPVDPLNVAPPLPLSPAEPSPATSSSTPSPSARPASAPACGADALRIDGTGQGATGNDAVGVGLTNTGTSACSLPGLPASVELLDSNGSPLNVTVEARPGSAVARVILRPGIPDDASLGLFWSNWCQTPPTSLQVRLTFDGLAGAIAGPLTGRLDARCDEPGQPSTLQVYPIVEAGN